jgi:hypothetical protein
MSGWGFFVGLGIGTRFEDGTGFFFGLFGFGIEDDRGCWGIEWNSNSVAQRKIIPNKFSYSKRDTKPYSRLKNTFLLLPAVKSHPITSQSTIINQQSDHSLGGKLKFCRIRVTPAIIGMTNCNSGTESRRGHANTRSI